MLHFWNCYGFYDLRPALSGGPKGFDRLQPLLLFVHLKNILLLSIVLDAQLERCCDYLRSLMIKIVSEIVVYINVFHRIQVLVL